MSLPDHGGWQHALVEHETALRALDGALETVTAERDSLRAALKETEATLKHIQPYVGLLVRYLPRCTHLVATARAHANRALASDEQEATESDDDGDPFGLDDFFSQPTVGYCSVCGEARTEFYTCRDGGATVAGASPSSHVPQED